MIDLLTSLFSDNSKVLILGYGKEGKSTYRFLRKNFPEQLLGIADSNTEIAKDVKLLNDNKLEIITGNDYLNTLKHFDIIIKSPGVKIDNDSSELSNKITSQTDLFLQCYAQQTIGVTGTKGKSTTSSLIRHFLEADNKKVLLLGNIGVPAFDMIDAIGVDTVIVYELSAHQLEYLSKSPHIAVLLNLFPEHLDYFNNFSDYQNAKLNICKFQNKNDCLIVRESLVRTLDLPECVAPGKFLTEIKNQEPRTRSQDLPECVAPGRVDNETTNQEPRTKSQDLSEYYPDSYRDGTVDNAIKSIHKGPRIIEISEINSRFIVEDPPLAGSHNLVNIEAALLAASEAGADINVAINSLNNFKSLPHRLEYVGEYDGIRYINDSISTIPESTIAAVKAIDGVDTLLLGGYDRGLDYTNMVKFLISSDVTNFIFLGKAGDRMYDIFKTNSDKNLFKVDSIKSAFKIIIEKTAKGSICLLSPAAASYDQFHNFEHRGDTFKLFATKL